MSDSRVSRLSAALFVTLSFVASAPAAVVAVDCGKKNAKSIGATLATLDRGVSNTVGISGTCSEHVVIERFRDLTLVGKPGARVSQPKPVYDADGNVVEGNDVLDIGPQSTVTIRSLTISGGLSGILCTDHSSCRLEDVTVQGADGDGVGVGHAGSTLSVLGNSVLQNNAGAGLGAYGASNVVVDALVSGGPYPSVHDNAGGGLRIWDGSFLRAVGATVQHNGWSDGSPNDSPGISADSGASLRLVTMTITDNGGDGVVLRASTARMTGLADMPMRITGNSGHGIRMSNLSFLRMNGSRVVSGNASPDVDCASTTAATVGTLNLGGGSTNCTEPAP